MYGTTPLYSLQSDSIDEPITLKRLLQHYAVYTNQTKENMTYLLQLLKRHQPTPHYDLLPSSGKQLMWIDGSDVVGFTAGEEELIPTSTTPTTESAHAEDNDTNNHSSMPADKTEIPPPSGSQNKKKNKKRPLKLPHIIELEGGAKLMYFGIESALAGDSPGLVFKNADLLQFASIYKRRPRCLTPRMRNRVNEHLYLNLLSTLM